MAATRAALFPLAVRLLCFFLRWKYTNQVLDRRILQSFFVQPRLGASNWRFHQEQSPVFYWEKYRAFIWCEPAVDQRIICQIYRVAPATANVILMTLYSIQCEPSQLATNTCCHHAVGVQCVYTLHLHDSQSSLWHRVQTPLFPHSSDCRSDLSTRTTQLLTSRKCGAFRVNERFHVGRAGLTAGGWGDLCVIQRGFPCFYDGENIVLPLSRWHTVPPGYHYCSGYYIFSCLNHVLGLFFL